MVCRGKAKKCAQTNKTQEAPVEICSIQRRLRPPAKRIKLHTRTSLHGFPLGRSLAELPRLDLCLSRKVGTRIFFKEHVFYFKQALHSKQRLGENRNDTYAKFGLQIVWNKTHTPPRPERQGRHSNTHFLRRRPYSSRRSSLEIGFRCMKLQKPPRVHSLGEEPDNGHPALVRTALSPHAPPAARLPTPTPFHTGGSRLLGSQSPGTAQHGWAVR